MIHRVERCFGLPLWGIKRHVELWVCFSGVKPHYHPRQEFEVIPLFGWATFTRVTKERMEQTIPIRPRNWFKALTVPAGWLHWFTTKFLIVITVSTTVNSAADNFRYL